MAENKNAQLRYAIYDRIFQNSYKKHTITSILAEVAAEMQERGGTGISQTLFYTDLKFLQDTYAAPIERYREGRNNYYRYTDTNFSIFNKAAILNPDDALLLSSSIAILRKFSGLPQLDFLENEQLLSRLDKIIENNDKQTKALVSFEDNLYYSGRTWLPTLLQYIYNSQPVQIKYKEFRQSELQTWRISPAHLRQYNARWFLFGASHHNNQIQRIPLDRVVDIHMLPEPYQPLFIDWADYFDEIIGTILPENATAETVHLRFDARIADYVISKPLHPSQKQYKKPDGSLEIKLKLIINWELDSLLFRYNENVEVLAPAHYRAHIAARVRAAAAKYSEL